MTAKLKQIADEADVIVNGYCFKRNGQQVSVVKLSRPDCAAVLTLSGDILETSMDDIELAIIRDYLQKNQKYMEVTNA